MKTTGTRILFVESSEKKNKIFIQMLTVSGYNVFTVANVEDAIHKTITLPPNIIICNEDFIEYNGFQVYKMLENELLKHGIPFIMLLNEYNREYIAMGDELGIDGFIYPPFEVKRIKNILDKKILKNQIKKSSTLKYFQEFWDLIPLGFFVVQNKRITAGNQHFIRAIGDNNLLSKNYFINETFNFNTHKTGENQLNRFLNGLDEICHIQNIQFKNKKLEFFNLTLFYLNSHLSTLNIMGCLIPSMHFLPLGTVDTQMKSDTDEEINHQDILTQREEQILNLSAMGKPIKSIAEQLGISIRTVEKHRSNIIQKTNAGNIIEAIIFAKKYHLIEL